MCLDLVLLYMVCTCILCTLLSFLKFSEFMLTAKADVHIPVEVQRF